MGNVTQLAFSANRNIQALSKNDKVMKEAKESLSTGKDVNHAIDNPVNFFASKQLKEYSNALDGRLDYMHQSIQKLNTAITGLDSIVDLLNVGHSKVDLALKNSSPEERRELGRQFNELLTHVYSVADDSYYQEHNLLQHNQKLDINFEQLLDESKLVIEGLDIRGPGKNGTGKLNGETREASVVPEYRRAFHMASLASAGSVASVAEVTAIGGNVIDPAIQSALWDQWNTVEVPITNTPFNIDRNASGGQAEDVYEVETGALKGEIEITYQMYSVTDSLNIYYEDQLVGGTGGYVSGSQTLRVPYGEGQSTKVKIIMNEGSGNSGTAWNYNLTIYPASTTTTETKIVNNGRSFNNLYAIAEIASNTSDASVRKELNDKYDVLLQQFYDAASPYMDLTHNGDYISYPGGDVSFGARTSTHWETGISEVNNSIAELDAIQAYINSAFAELSTIIVTPSAASHASRASIPAYTAYGEYAFAVGGESGVAGLRSFGTNSNDAFGHEIDWGSEKYKSLLSELQNEIDDLQDFLLNESKKFTGNINVVNIREEWIDEKMSILSTGADNLVLADMNAESAKLLSAETQQQVAFSALKLSSESSQGILKMISS